MKCVKRSIVMLLVVATMFSMMAVSASASVWRTGDFVNKGKWTSAHTITLKNEGKNGYVTFHAYHCDKGRGHSGACQNSYEQTDFTFEIQYLKTGLKPQWQKRNVLKLPKGQCCYTIRIAGANGKKDYAHWGIEGTSNVSKIS